MMKWIKWIFVVGLLLGAAFLWGLERVNSVWGDGIGASAMAKKHLRGDAAIYGPAGGGDFYTFKRDVLAGRQPDIAVIGSTRSFRYREEFFKPYSFYNGGGVSRNPVEFERLLKAQPESWQPKLIIMPIEAWNFKPGRTDYVPDTGLSFSEKIQAAWEQRKRTYPNSLWRWRKDPILVFNDPVQRDDGLVAYGALAQDKGIGVRPDGSLNQDFVADIDLDRHTRRVEISISKVEQNLGNKGLLQDLNQRPDEGTWEVITRIAAEADRRGAALVMYAPPISPAYFPYMEDEGENALFYYLASDEMKSRMAALNIIYFDYSRFEDRDPPVGMIDLLHPSEGLEFDMWRDMLKSEWVRAAVPDMDMENLSDLAKRAEPHRVIYD